MDVLNRWPMIIHFNKILGVSNPRCKPRLSDSFFEIGGTSINAVAVVSKINESISVSVENFIQAKTIGDLIFSKTESQQSNLTPMEPANDDIEVCNTVLRIP